MAESILQGVSKGESAAVRACLDRFGGLVWSLARRMSPTRTDAEDAAQEIFLDVWRNAARFDPAHGSETAFVAMVARRRMLDRLNRARRRALAVATAEAPPESGAAPDPESSLPDEAGVAAAAVEGLPEEQIEALRMVILKGRTLAQVADATGEAPGAVLGHVRGALKLVQERLGGGSAGGLADFLADRAAFGLDPESESELAQLLGEREGVDEEAFDRAAAALFLAFEGGEREELPPEMHERLAALGTLWVKGDVSIALIEGADEVPEMAGKFGVRGWLGWVVGAAAVLFAAVTMWERPSSAWGPAGDALGGLEAFRARRGVVALPLQQAQGDTAAAVAGEVLWSDVEGRGYLVFERLPELDPETGVYQVWVFDPERDARFPVHGGVFNAAPGGGAYVVPIEPRLPVTSPRRFAVTVERPGGVWVSDGSRTVATAER